MEVKSLKVLRRHPLWVKTIGNKGIQRKELLGDVLKGSQGDSFRMALVTPL